MKTIILMLAVLALSGNALGHNSKSITIQSPITTPPVPIGSGNVEYSFQSTIDFKRIYDYQFAFSIGPMTSCSSDVNSPVHQANLRSVIPGQIAFSDNSGDNSCLKKFDFGTWSNGCEITTLNYHKQLKPRFTFKINRTQLNNLNNAQLGKWNSLHLVVKDKNQQTCDSEPLFIGFGEEVKVKISKLKDRILTTNNSDLSSAVEMPFCVYKSNGGTYALKANGQHDTGNQFHLSNGQELASYSMLFEQSGNVLLPGQMYTAEGSNDESCNLGYNAKLKIFLSSSPASAGVYEDTVTLTVSTEP
ncbi:hypothetical protein [Endozoicomonas ascidiicola]|uniref:hypothetical protein n=1 Tax=Endozoicomonas ascidiicola TaxID=1698521 RepID=UPI000B31FD2C|nr:hypothetical protein [Endozoicomonas ascidiicola]